MDVTTVHLGIFLGWALRAYSVSLQVNTIGSCDKFKPVRIIENLVVNYKIVIKIACLG